MLVIDGYVADVEELDRQLMVLDRDVRISVANGPVLCGLADTSRLLATRFPWILTSKVRLVAPGSIGLIV